MMISTTIQHRALPSSRSAAHEHLFFFYMHMQDVGSTQAEHGIPVRQPKKSSVLCACPDSSLNAVLQHTSLWRRDAEVGSCTVEWKLEGVRRGRVLMLFRNCRGRGGRRVRDRAA